MRTALMLMLSTLLLGATVAPGRQAPQKGDRPRLLRPALPPPGACQELNPPQMAPRLPFGPGESLSYTATVNGLNAGSADITLQDRLMVDGKPVYPAVVKASSNPVVSLWVQMNAELLTMVDPDSSTPVKMHSLTTADKVRYEEEWTREGGDIVVHTVLNGKGWDARWKPDGVVVDALSVLYYARSRVVSVGQKYCLQLYQGRTLWRVDGQVTGRETVQTDAGPFETLVVSGVAGIPGRPGSARTYTAWVTDDEDRIPVQLKTPSPMGEVTARLVRFEQGRRLVRGAP